MLIVGSGTCGGKPGKEMPVFLENLKPVENKRAACFSSCVGDASKTLDAMKNILSEKGYTIKDCLAVLESLPVYQSGGTQMMMNYGKL